MSLSPNTNSDEKDNDSQYQNMQTQIQDLKKQIAEKRKGREGCLKKVANNTPRQNIRLRPRRTLKIFGKQNWRCGMNRS